MFFCSVRTRGNFSPARNVLSTTDPLARPFSLVRTNAPPFPGLTCWNSTMRHVWPSSSMCMPLRNWFVETTSAMGAECSQSAPLEPGSTREPGSGSSDLGQLLGERREDVDPVVADDRQVLDAHASDALEIDARLDRDRVAGAQRVVRLEREPRRL